MTLTPYDTGRIEFSGIATTGDVADTGFAAHTMAFVLLNCLVLLATLQGPPPGGARRGGRQTAAARRFFARGFARAPLGADAHARLGASGSNTRLGDRPSARRPRSARAAWPYLLHGW